MPLVDVAPLIIAQEMGLSGQPENKAGVVSVRRFDAAWYGFAVSRCGMQPVASYWAVARTQAGFRVELAGSKPVADWESEARRLFGASAATLSSFHGTVRGLHRIALSDKSGLVGAIFVAGDPVAFMRDYLATLPGTYSPQVLGGCPPQASPIRGRCCIPASASL